MGAKDLLRLPPGVMVLVVVMLWPAILAAAQLIIALAGDVIRQTKTHTGGVFALRDRTEQLGDR